MRAKHGSQSFALRPMGLSLGQTKKFTIRRSSWPWVESKGLFGWPKESAMLISSALLWELCASSELGRAGVR